MEKIKNLVTVLAIAFGIAFFDGMFGWGLSANTYLVLGTVDLVCIIWLLKLVYNK